MRKRATFLLTVAFGAAVLTPAHLAAAAEPICQTDTPVVGDVDGDALSDLVVGLPGWDGGRGAVDLRLTSAPSQSLTKSAAGYPESEPGDRFGAAVALADLDADGCDDLIIGAPGTLDDAGRVHLVSGSPGGFRTTGRLTLAGGATPADRFGSSIAIAENPQLPGFDLWVGSPYDSPGAVAGAGSVTHFAVTTLDGTVQVNTVETLSQATPGVPGVPEAGDHFGAVLAASRAGLLVGVPDEDIGSLRDAGAVTMLAVQDAAPGFDGATSWTQATAGVEGKPEADDRFGAAVTAFFGHVVAGVPGEDVGTRRDAGMLQTFDQPWNQKFAVPVAGITQDSRGIPGVAEAGDQLGAAVLIGRNVGCVEGVTQAVVGAPGEDIRVAGTNRADAGTVLVLPLTAASSCPVRSDDQNTVLAGTPEAGDRLGSALGLGRIRDDHDDELGDRAFVGVPGEDRGSVANAGIVESTAVGSRTNANDVLVAGRFRPSVGFSRGAVAGMRYGTVFASPAD
ncbi:MAG: hypothetical protein QOF52_880 [Propionibacteriaceae bacterium]|jgi:hypothetical protein|nr:repeat-containing protein [Propionibacteriaceae bacterium]MDX6321022.1 hypothetical protein [Propionibacteriaceae bacterium]